MACSEGTPEVVRWAFRFGSWKPSRDDWERGLRCVQVEEMERVHKYIYQKDAKASLAGRLLLRRAVHLQLDISWTDIVFARTKRGKPYLANTEPGAQGFSVNVSHHGNFTVLAASKTYQVGIDVMKIEWPKNGGTLEHLFSVMFDQFTDYEWSKIREPYDEWDQLCMFHRYWSLKESYVKAVGIGLNVDLQRKEFRVESELSQRHITSDTKLYIDGELQKNWRFEETLLDATHTSATALYFPSRLSGCAESGSKFQKLTVAQLLDVAAPLGHVLPEDAYCKYKDIKDKPGRRLPPKYVYS